MRMISNLKGYTRAMGGSGGIVYTAHTKLGRILCKLDRVAQLDRYGGGCYIAGLSQRDIGICFTPWRVVNIIIQVVFTFVHAK